MSWWDDIVSVVSDVADLAGKILPVVLGATASPDDAINEGNSYTFGPLLFVPGALVGAPSGIYAVNATSQTVNLTMAIAASGTTSLVASIPASGVSPVDVSSFAAFSDGLLTLTLAPPQGGAEAAVTPPQMLTYSIGAIGLSVAAAIFPGFTVSVKRTTTPTSTFYSASFINNNPMAGWLFRARLTDQNGREAEVSGSASSAGNLTDGPSEVDLLIPHGLDLDRGARRLDVTITMPAGDFERVTAEGRRRLRFFGEDVARRLPRRDTALIAGVAGEP